MSKITVSSFDGLVLVQQEASAVISSARHDFGKALERIDWSLHTTLAASFYRAFSSSWSGAYLATLETNRGTCRPSPAVAWPAPLLWDRPRAVGADFRGRSAEHVDAGSTCDSLTSALALADSILERWVAFE